MATAFHTRIYRLLLLLFPRSWRARHGAEMEALFVEMWKDCRWGGSTWAKGKVSFWVRAVSDTTNNAFRVRFPAKAQEGRLRTSLPRTRNLMETLVTDVRMAIRSIRRSILPR